jgi:hypothetical protein
MRSSSDIYGTVRMTRKDMPSTKKTRKIKKAELVTFQRGESNNWPCARQRRDVILLSTMHNEVHTYKLTRRQNLK